LHISTKRGVTSTGTKVGVVSVGKGTTSVVPIKTQADAPSAAELRSSSLNLEEIRQTPTLPETQLVRIYR
jgi:hypothetical protein